MSLIQMATATPLDFSETWGLTALLVLCFAGISAYVIHSWPRLPRTQERVFVLVCYALLAAPFGFGIAYGVRDIARARRFSQAPLLDEVSRTHREVLNSDWSLPGKVAVFTKDKKVHGIMFDLADTVRAQSPEDVKAIAVVDCRSKIVGQYTDGSKAATQYCDIEVIDRADSTLRARKRLFGGPAPRSYSYSPGPFKNPTPRVGPAPEDSEILAFISGLQPKPPKRPTSEQRLDKSAHAP
jgi:hypothetical protein